MEDFEPIWALGLMSGTSMDGIDAALLCTDGERVAGHGLAATQPYGAAFRERLRGVLGSRGGKGKIRQVAEELTQMHAKAALELIEVSPLEAADVAVLGFHGHTILHAPKKHRTVQIGDGELLARLTGIDVVCDFRSADIAAGGEGAPLTPLYHQARAQDLERPLAVLNLGGVANVTWIGAGGALLAFDTGPGNALIDDWAVARTGQPFDRNGKLAHRGKANEAFLQGFLEDPYFWRAPPKSLDRDAFTIKSLGGLSPEDGSATLTALTARTVALAAERHFPSPVERWLVTGGGRRNPALMGMLRDCLNAEVAPVEIVGWNGDSLEAEAFAFLAVRSLRGLPLTLPSTTGVARPATGGVFHAAPKR